MNSVMKISLVVILCFAILDLSEATSKRHVLYWNSFMTPQLKSDEIVTHVRIGEFMDILCPQSSLMGITDSHREPATFDLFNVTGSEYKQCHTSDRRKFIFSCDRPERENKLTLKFQTISPSPLGFRFQYCQDYFIIAIQRGQASKPGCTKESTRIHIRVGCKEPETTTPPPTTTTEEVIIPDLSFLNRLKIETTRRNNMLSPEPTEFDEELFFPRNDVIIPNVVAPSHGVPRVLESGDNQGSGCSKSNFNFSILFISIIVFLLTQFET